MSKGYSLSQVVNGDIGGGFRNKIINGNFGIWQRGPSFSVSGYTADRWKVAIGAGSTGAITPVEYTRGVNFMRLIRSATGTEPFILSQSIEDIYELAGKRVTVTFDTLKTGTVPTLPIDVYLVQDFGPTPGSPAITLASQQIIATTTMTRHRLKFTLGGVSNKIFGTSPNVRLVFSIPASAGDFGSFSPLMLSRVSLVVGDATAEADPFSPRHISQELALCRRYYERVAVSARGYSPVTNGYFENTVSFVPKRALPAVTLISAPSELNVGAKLLAPYSNGYDHSSARFSVGSAAIGDVYSLGTIYALDAEL